MSVLSLLAVLVPGLALEDQPRIDPPRMDRLEAIVLLEDRPAWEPPAWELPAVWADLADCESGDWLDRGAAFVPGSARWSWAAPGNTVPPWGTRVHHGGLQFHPDTWAWLAPVALANPPRYAYDATIEQQVAVAEEVLARQGWAAWPVCSRLLGYR